MVLDGLNGTFGLGDMFFGGSNVEVDSAKFQERVTDAGELFVSVSDSKVETRDFEAVSCKGGFEDECDSWGCV